MSLYELCCVKLSLVELSTLWLDWVELKLSLLLLEIIDCTYKVENLQNKDIISKNLLSFLKDSLIFKKIHIDGGDFYPNYEG